MSPVSSTGRAAASDSEIGNDARPGARRATPWEQFVIGLDRDFDQFRRTFGAQPADNGEAKTENAAGPSAWNHTRATDEAIASLWPENEASSLAGRSGLPNPEGQGRCRSPYPRPPSRWALGVPSCDARGHGRLFVGHAMVCAMPA